MDDSLLDLDPGAYAAASALGQNNGALGTQSNLLTTAENQVPDSLAPLETLAPQPTISNLLNSTTPTMDTSLNSPDPTSWLTGTSGSNNLLSFGESIGTNLLNAFVTNPQNAQTAAQSQAASASITSALASQYFGYVIIIFIGYFLISMLGRK